MNKTLLSHLALFTSTVIFGANYYISKDLLSGIVNPEQFIFIRTLGATILFWIVGFFVKSEIPDKKTLLILIPAAFFGVFINQILFFKGLESTTAVNAAIIHVCNPIIVMVMSMIFLNLPITIFRSIGVVIGAIGATILILLDKELTFAMDSMKGNFLILFGTIAYGAYLIIAKPILNKYSSLVIMKWIYLFSMIMIFPFTIKQVSTFEFASLNINSIVSLIFVIVVVTFFAYLLTIYALRNLVPTVVSYYIYLQPIIASLIAYYLGGETLGIAQFFAAILIIIGVILVNKNSKIENMRLSSDVSIRK